jgi:hypothetical protein
VGTNICEPSHLDEVEDPSFVPFGPKVKWVVEGCQNSYGASVRFGSSTT